MVHEGRESPGWAPLLAARSLSQSACSEAVVFIFAFTCSVIRTNLDLGFRFRAKFPFRLGLASVSQSYLFSRHTLT